MTLIDFLQTVGIGLAAGASIYNTRTLRLHLRMIGRLQADVIDLKFNPKSDDD